MHPERRIQTIAARQGGVVTRTQALSAGLTDRQIGGRVDSDRWSRISNGGYRLNTMDGKRNLVRAAVAVLPDAIVSHSSAAALNELRYADTRTVSVTVHASTTHQFPGVVVYRTRDLVDNHTGNVDDIPTTSIARTIVDLAAVTNRRRLSLIVSDAIASQKTSPADIDRVLSQVARRGKPGVAALRLELEHWIGAPRDASALEQAGFRLLESSGFASWHTEFPIPWLARKRFDVAFPDQQVAVEWDSRRWHTLAASFESDRKRDADALAHGWRVLRFTWGDIHRRPQYAVSTLRSVLDIAR